MVLESHFVCAKRIWSTYTQESIHNVYLSSSGSWVGAGHPVVGDAQDAQCMADGLELKVLYRIRVIPKVRDAA